MDEFASEEECIESGGDDGGLETGGPVVAGSGGGRYQGGGLRVGRLEREELVEELARGGSGPERRMEPLAGGGCKAEELEEDGFGRFFPDLFFIGVSDCFCRDLRLYRGGREADIVASVVIFEGVLSSESQVE